MTRLRMASTLGIALVAIAVVVLTRTQRSTVTNAEGVPATPDLSGVWMQRDIGDTFAKEAPPLQPWAVERTAANLKGGSKGDPEEQCFPPGLPRIYIHRYPIEILQRPGRTLVVFEYDHFVRQIWTDGRGHPTEGELDPTWMGHSIGKWDGDAFVVDTIGFNDKTWLDNAGHPHSDALHLTERMRRADNDTLQIDFTFEDPKAYTKTWTGQKIFKLRSGWEISEHVCADNFLWKEPGKAEGEP